MNSTNLHVGQCQLQGQSENGVVVVGSQHVELLKNDIAGATNWGVMTFAGTAYLKAEANTVRDCRRGISLGGGSLFSLMTAPWLHYEIYDARVVNNLLHDVTGTPLNVAGGYNVLIAWNTLYRVATDETEAAPLFQPCMGRATAQTTACAQPILLCDLRREPPHRWAASMGQPEAYTESLPSTGLMLAWRRKELHEDNEPQGHRWLR